MPASADAIGVFVVEDLPMIRQALELLLDGTPGYRCAGTAASAEAALAAGPDPAAPAGRPCRPSCGSETNSFD